MGQELAIFLIDSCKFLSEEIIGAQHYNFVPKFPQNENVQPQMLHCWTKNFLTRFSKG